MSLGLVSRLATREDVDAALREMRPFHLRPDMPLCHAKDLRVPKTFREARDGEHGAQFMDAAKRKLLGLLESGAFPHHTSLPIRPVSVWYVRWRVSMT